MDEKGFWIFTGRENRVLTGGVVKEPESFPILHIYILKKDNIKIKTVKTFTIVGRGPRTWTSAY